MRYIKFFTSALLTLGFIALLNTYNPLGMASMPALGRLFSPFTGFWQNAEPLEAFSSETLALPGLSETVTIVYDERLVPHVFAANLADAYRAQGYLTARHRLWQMDLAARSGAGRLSEIIGPRTLAQDRFQRRRGLPLGAQRMVESLEGDGENLQLIQAYTEGINSYIENLSPADYPVEFKLLGYAPEPWEPYKSALVLKLNAATLCFREDDVEATNTLALLGLESFNYLFQERPPVETPIVPDEYLLTDSLQPPKATSPDSDALSFWQVQPLPKPSPFLGSNNWAVSGDKTASGHPILCNDPHLNLSLPSLWMEIQLHTPEMNVYGVTLPGLPGVLLGFNEHVAWGWTNAGHDVLDWYEVNWTGPEQTHYFFDDEQRPVTQKVEEIQVRGQKTIYDTITYTHWGPIVHEDAAHPKRNLAMRWAALETPGFPEMQFLAGMNGARNYDEFQEASRHFRFPGQNMAFISREGDIAMTVTGQFPVRQPGQGRFVQTGDASVHFWKDYIPFEDLPRMKNPERGFVESANQFSTGPAYPYYYTGNFNAYRGRYIERVLASRNDLTINDMMDLQTSNFSILPQEALPAMLNYLDSTRLSAIDLGLLQLLHEWDYRFDASQAAPVLFEEWWQALDKALWDEFYAARDTLSILHPPDWRTVQLLREDPFSIFWDMRATPEQELPTQTVTHAFLKAMEAVRPVLGEVQYNWGKHYPVSIPHLARIPAFSTSELHTGGHPEAPNAIRPQNGPSWRMIVEMGPEIRAYGVYPGGQSGNPGSPYYDNFVETWAKGDYYELFFMDSPQDRRQAVLFEQALTPAR
jgi:penicillin amidase